ncbi:MAG: hypothetical protein IKO00_16780 [Oscillospiraceae bacterium]|nr:hypothetical protein [Oscillospiraceae bacterium]
MRILGAVIIAAGLLLFAQFQYLPALICIVIGAIFMGKPRAPKRVEQDGEPIEEPDSELVRVDAQLKKVRSMNSEHRRLAFPVDGVLKNNDDGTSRQAALRTLCEGEDLMVVEVWFDDYLFGGKLNIRVMTEQGCVGEIRPKDVATVRSYFGTSVRMIYLEITKAEGSTGEDEYHADVVIIEETEKKERDVSG